MRKMEIISIYCFTTKGKIKMRITGMCKRKLKKN